MKGNNIKLSNPPLKETFCSINFSNETPWDEVTTGLIFNMLQELGSIGFNEREKKEVYKILENEEDDEPIFEKIERIIVRDKDEERGVILFDRGISVNYLNGFYDSWEDYIQIIKLVFNGVANIIGSYGISNYKLGYLNEFELASENELEEYFGFKPSLKEGYDLKEIRSFIQGVELKIEKPPGILRTTFTNYSKKEINKVNYELLFSSFEIDIQKISDLFPLLNEAHEEIEMQFFGTVHNNLIDRCK